MNMEIIDASFLLIHIKKEKGWETTTFLFNEAQKKTFSLFIHQINYIEVIYKCLHFYGKVKTDQIIADFKSPYLGIVNYMDTDLGLYASTLKSQYHLSLGDAVGLAHTRIMNGRFWTADKALEEIGKKENITVRIFR
jgi:PIN domain nuclease of toxin-antitoxin system